MDLIVTLHSGLDLPSDFISPGIASQWIIIPFGGGMNDSEYMASDLHLRDWAVTTSAPYTSATITIPDDFYYPCDMHLVFSPDGVNGYEATFTKDYPLSSGFAGDTIRCTTWRYGNDPYLSNNTWAVFVDNGCGTAADAELASTADPKGYAVVPEATTAPAYLDVTLPEGPLAGTGNLIWYRDTNGITYKATFSGRASSNEAQFGSFIDHTGTLYSAVNEGDNVRVSRFKQGVASRELLALASNAKNPSLFQKADGRIVLGYTDRASGDFIRAQSENFGRSFS